MVVGGVIDGRGIAKFAKSGKGRGTEGSGVYFVRCLNGTCIPSSNPHGASHLVLVVLYFTYFC